MAIQITDIRGAILSEPGTLWGIAAYVAALASCLLQTQWEFGFGDLEIFVLPEIPWFIAVLMLVAFKKKPLRRYWWVLPSALLANPSLVILCWMLLAWSIGGFV
jgi:hypothetical protein